MDASGFYPGDRPAEALEVVPLELDLALYDEATGQARRPDGSDGGTFAVALEGDEDEQQLALDLGTLDFDMPGVWQLEVTVQQRAVDGGPAPRRRRVAPIQVVVQDPASGWHTLDTARASPWPDARELPDVGLHALLESARRDVLAFAPALPASSPVPQAYRDGQLMQARNRHNAGATAADGDGGLDGFALTVRPLDWQVKQLLRPRRGRPAAS